MGLISDFIGGAADTGKDIMLAELKSNAAKERDEAQYRRQVSLEEFRNKNAIGRDKTSRGYAVEDRDAGYMQQDKVREDTQEHDLIKLGKSNRSSSDTSIRKAMLKSISSVEDDLRSDAKDERAGLISREELTKRREEAKNKVKGIRKRYSQELSSYKAKPVKSGSGKSITTVSRDQFIKDATKDSRNSAEAAGAAWDKANGGATGKGIVGVETAKSDNPDPVKTEVTKKPISDNAQDLHDQRAKRNDDEAKDRELLGAIEDRFKSRSAKPLSKNEISGMINELKRLKKTATKSFGPDFLAKKKADRYLKALQKLQGSK